MTTTITSNAVHSHNGPEFVCFLCRRLHKTLNDESNQPIEKSKQQHFQKLFQCCTNYQWPNSLNKYFELNYEMENLLELCADCLLSLEKLFEMNERLEEMLDGIKGFIGYFAKEVLDYHKQSEFLNDTLQMEEGNAGSHLNDPCMKYSSSRDIVPITVDLDYIESVCFEMEDAEEYNIVGDFRDESCAKTSNEDQQLQNNDMDFPEINILAQEQILVAKYNASDLDALHQLKNLRVILKRLEESNVENETVPNERESQNNTFKCQVCQVKFHEKILLARHLCVPKCGYPTDICIQNGEVTDENLLNVQAENSDASDAAISTTDSLEMLVELGNEGVNIPTSRESECNIENRTSDMAKSNVDTPVINQKESDYGNSTASFAADVVENNLDDISENNEEMTENEKDVTLVLQHNITSNTTSPMNITTNICQTIFPNRYLPGKDLYEQIKDKITSSTVEKHQYQVAKRFKCITCQFACNFAKQLLVHSAETGHVNEKTYKCDPCGRTYFKWADFNTHLLREHKIVFKCPQCSKIFVAKQFLIKHIKLVHRSQADFKCEICEKTFLHKINLTHHMAIHKRKPSPYTCTICNETFQLKILLDEHIQVHDNGNFKCATCAEEFKSKYVLHQHSLIHKKSNTKKLKRQFTMVFHKTLKYSCSKSSTKNHLQGPNPVPTELCSEVIKSPTNRVVNDENFLFECQLCQKYIAKSVGHSLKSSLQNHRQAIHRNVNCYECDICGYFFREREELQYHKNMYTNETQVYQCQLCFENFHTKFDLYIHHKCVSDCETAYKKKVQVNFRQIQSKSINIMYDRDILQCQICNIFVEPEKIYSHFNTHAPYKCHICESTFNSTIKLNMHKTHVHSDELPHKCSMCDFAFKCVADQTKHEKEKHSSRRKYLCDFCGKVIIRSTRAEFLKHQHAHFVSYHCHLCDKSYKSRGQFSDHQRKTH